LNILELIGRKNRLFHIDISNNEKKISDIISTSRFLILGGAGTIGQAVSKEIFARNPKKNTYC
jgi:FlaA1/EpsC-like NDP-sugar epimerase